MDKDMEYRKKGMFFQHKSQTGFNVTLKELTKIQFETVNKTFVENFASMAE